MSRLFLILITFILAGCTTEYHAPVAEVGGGSVSVPSRASSVQPLTGRTHQVNSGETLYAIAFQYDLDFSALAQANEISAPYVIFPGQTLSLETNNLPPPRNTSPVRVTGTNNPTVRTIGTGPTNAIMRWGWPSEGNVIGQFSNSGVENKGIDIAGQEGDDVLAAESGEVVYAGSGLLRYGDLLIIKHNDQFLSAYAHNSELIVTEGDQVRRGQKIAALGSTGIDREMLHFEIRLNGNPVDPIDYLPPK
jgi:lipoprotein NlpD